MVRDSAYICGKPVCVWGLTAWIRVNTAQPLKSDPSREEMIV